MVELIDQITSDHTHIHNGGHSSNRQNPIRNQNDEISTDIILNEL